LLKIGRHFVTVTKPDDAHFSGVGLVAAKRKYLVLILT